MTARPRSPLDPRTALHYNALQMEDQLTVRLPRDLSRALEAASKRMHRRSSEIVRMALREYLQEKPGGERSADRVRGLLGSIDSGQPDLAERDRELVLESLKRGR